MSAQVCRSKHSNRMQQSCIVVAATVQNNVIRGRDSNWQLSVQKSWLKALAALALRKGEYGTYFGNKDAALPLDQRSF